MKRSLQNLCGVVVVLLLIGGPLAYGLHYQAQFRNFKVVREGVLLRSGQLPAGALKQVTHDYNIRTIVSLRDAAVPGMPPPDLAEEEYCRKQEINFYRLPPRHWWALHGPAPVEENVRTFREVMANPANYPVLVHCFAGIHRTGAYCAIYRMEQDHWTNEQAITELKAQGYSNLEEDWDIFDYLENYHPTWQGSAPDTREAVNVKKSKSVVRKKPSRTEE